MWQWRGVWGTASLSAIATIALRGLGILQPWELGTFDFYLRLRPLRPADPRIAIVGIDEEDVRQQGTAIFSDRTYARAIAKLAAMQPRAIGLDVYRDIAIYPGHQELMEVLAETPNVIGIEKTLGDGEIEVIPGHPSLKREGRVGANDIIQDADGRVRRGFAYVQKQGEQSIPSLAAALAGLYLKAEEIEPEQVKATEFKRWGKALLMPLKPQSGGYIRAKTGGGFQLLIDYRGDRRYFETIPLRDVLADRVAEDWGRDRIILIGQIGESSGDIYLTPYSNGILHNPQPIAGVEIHAHLTSQFMRAALDGEPLFRVWPEWAEIVWIACWCLLGAGLSWTWRYGIEARGRVHLWRSLREALVSLGTAGFLFVGTYSAILRECVF